MCVFFYIFYRLYLIIIVIIKKLLFSYYEKKNIDIMMYKCMYPFAIHIYLFACVQQHRLMHTNTLTRTCSRAPTFREPQLSDKSHYS